MKKRKIFYLLILFTVLYIYMTNIDKIPEKIVLFQNEDYEISHLRGINIEGSKIYNEESFFSKLSTIKTDSVGKSNLKLSFLGGIFNKDIEVSVLPTTKVIIGGDTVGIRLYSKGVLVIGKSAVQGTDGNYYEPYSTTNIQNGDEILSVNDIETETILELTDVVSNLNEEEKVNIKYNHDGNIIEEEIKPVISLEDGENKLGLWVRDGAMGVGTLTFYEPVLRKNQCPWTWNI